MSPSAIVTEAHSGILQVGTAVYRPATTLGDPHFATTLYRQRNTEWTLFNWIPLIALGSAWSRAITLAPKEHCILRWTVNRNLSTSDLALDFESRKKVVFQVGAVYLSKSQWVPRTVEIDAKTTVFRQKSVFQARVA